MGEVTLYPDRLEVHRHPGHTATLRPACVREFLPYLLYSLEIDPDVTLGDIFRLVDREDVEELEVLLDCRIAPLLGEARGGTIDPGGAGVIHFLRVSHRHEFGSLRLELDAPGSRERLPDGNPEALERHDERYTVSLEPVGKLLHLPIRYDPTLLFRNDAYDVEYRATIDVTLIRFLKAVFDDLTFHGTPAQRDETRREILHLVERIDRGEEEMFPHAEVKRRLRATLDHEDGRES